LYKEFVLEKRPFVEGKKRVELPYLDHRFLYVSMAWKKINLVNDLLVDNC
jgi:hypothetical protein